MYSKARGIIFSAALFSSIALGIPYQSPAQVAALYSIDRRQAGTIPPNATISIDPAYPTDVGYPGPIKTGSPPFLVETNSLLSSRPLSGRSVEDRYVPHGTKNETDFELIKHWGNTSPWFPSPLFPEAQKHRSLSPGCSIEEVYILHRHADRYPTTYSTEGAPFFGQTIANASENGKLNAHGPLSFLNNWTYELGAEILTPYGAQELFDSGVKAYYQYGRLYNSTRKKPVIRTTSEERMLDSARYWTAGFFGLDAPNLIDLQVILEGSGFNNTLASYDTCNNSNKLTIGDMYLTPVWEELYLKKARSRLQKYIPSIKLTPKLLYGMQSLCAYETVGLGYSNFCELFTEEEWRGFEYFLDLQFQGDYGNMNPSGRAQGIGWAQELLARLSKSKVNTAQITTQNTSYPIELNQKLNVDFTHDDIIVSVLSALNYTQVVGDYLSAKRANPKRTFVLSHIVPFAARLIFEVFSCDGRKYIRTLLNDALVPMDESQGCMKPRRDGSCLLEEFISYQNKHAYKTANFEKACFGKNGTDFVITGPSVHNGTVS